MKIHSFQVLLTLLATLVASHANANLVVNGDFELGDYNNLDSDSRPQIMLITPDMNNITGWTVEGAKGVHWVADTVKDGMYSVDLQGDNPSSSSDYSTLWTEFSTIVGNQYKLAFDAFTGNVINTGSVSVGNIVNRFFTGGGPVNLYADPVFDHYVLDFYATSTVSRLTFSLVGTNGFGPVIDNVVVDNVSSIPVPSSVLLLSASFIGLIGILRKVRYVK